jgi:hypothetical protein
VRPLVGTNRPWTPLTRIFRVPLALVVILGEPLAMVGNVENPGLSGPRTK